MTNEKEKYIIGNVFGDMAQLVERLVRNEEASGSNPLISTIVYGRLAQLVEQLTLNQWAQGSSP